MSSMCKGYVALALGLLVIASCGGCSGDTSTPTSSATPTSSGPTNTPVPTVPPTAETELTDINAETIILQMSELKGEWTEQENGPGPTDDGEESITSWMVRYTGFGKGDAPETIINQIRVYETVDAAKAAFKAKRADTLSSFIRQQAYEPNVVDLMAVESFYYREPSPKTGFIWLRSSNIVSTVSLETPDILVNSRIKRLGFASDRRIQTGIP